MTQRVFQFLRRVLAGSAVLAVFACCIPSGPAAAEDGDGSMITSPDGYQGLLLKVQKNGTVRVIVKHRIPFTPDALLSKTDADNQRTAISQVQDQLLAGLTAAGHKPSSSYKFKYVPHMALTVDNAALGALIASPDVVSIEEDIPIPAVLDLSVPRIGATTLHSKGITGNGITVAILDTGVDKTHPFLAGSVVSEACYSSNDTTYVSSTICPGGVTESTATGSALPYASGVCPAGDCDHGTHVAGIAAGRNGVSGSPGPGVAPEASVIAIQVFSRFDSPYSCDGPSPCVRAFLTDILKGLEQVYTLRNSYSISSINLSMGARYYSTYCDSNNTLIDIIDTLRVAGIATVIASGNDGLCGYISFPACTSSAISVGATDDSDAVADYSNSAKFVSLLAPGSDINSSIPGGGYASWNGTSMATPHVTGAWALMKQRNPNASVSDILKAFTSTGLSIKDTKCSSVTKKRINVNEAYDKLPPKANVSPSSLNFGSVKSEYDSSSKTVTISNKAGQGGRSMLVNSITIGGTDAADFSATNTCTTLLARGASCTASVIINPATFGKKSALLSVSTDDPKKPLLSVKLKGTASPPSISISPTKIDFGSVASGTIPAAKKITIKNIGVSDLNIRSVAVEGVSSPFAQTNSCGVIVKGGSCTVTVTFAPVSTGSMIDTIDIVSDDPAKGTVKVRLSGKGK